MPTDLEIQLTNAHLQVKQARERLTAARDYIPFESLGWKSSQRSHLQHLADSAHLLALQIHDALDAAAAKDAP